MISILLSALRCSGYLRDPHAIWKEINRLSSEGKWDSINNMPRMFLFGSAKRETYAAYNAIAGVMLYEFIIPEEKRLHYKYRNKHEDSHASH
ncbi:hypothetical protein DICVIV_13667 [Dictyocaulus viviparus]|uniref:Uncharacterized protein n=1 Tax=Dictyocaulus viviparus TaxID=29172 RepID=A0A0D8X9D5_DICVI|nr:hypothetical protein DICVIV_13667 [Dictyocaulus viviparus]